MPSRHQTTFSINVWAGVIGDKILGPVFLLPRLNGENYLQFLEEELPRILEDLPLGVRNRMFFMHDGAPVHYWIILREHLD